MNLKNFLILLGLQIFGILWAIWVFTSPMPRHIAGLTAGTVFLLVGAFPVLALRKNPNRQAWIVFWSAIIFLVCSAIPIFALRLIFWGQEFSTIEVMGLKASQLHAWSQSFYVAMMVSALVDGVRFFILPRIKKGS